MTDEGRRKLLTALGASAVAPKVWAQPLVEAVNLPDHASASPVPVIFRLECEKARGHINLTAIINHAPPGVAISWKSDIPGTFVPPNSTETVWTPTDPEFVGWVEYEATLVEGSTFLAISTCRAYCG